MKIIPRWFIRQSTATREYAFLSAGWRRTFEEHPARLVLRIAELEFELEDLKQKFGPVKLIDWDVRPWEEERA